MLFCVSSSSYLCVPYIHSSKHPSSVMCHHHHSLLLLPPFQNILTHSTGAMASKIDALQRLGSVDYTRYVKRFASATECGSLPCNQHNYREHFHCLDCNNRVFVKKEEMIRHFKWHKKRDESLQHGFMRYSPCDDCGDHFTNCAHNRKQTHYHCLKRGCEKVSRWVHGMEGNGDEERRTDRETGCRCNIFAGKRTFCHGRRESNKKRRMLFFSYKTNISLYLSLSLPVSVVLHFTPEHIFLQCKLTPFLPFPLSLSLSPSLDVVLKHSPLHLLRYITQTYISTSDVQMHANYHRKDTAIIQEGFQRFRATEDCLTESCPFMGQKTTHFHW